MSRKVLLQLVLPLIGLSVLFWLLAFAPGDKHHQPALLEMSVILRDGDGNVSAMRKGMEQAAKDLNVELRFLTPAEDNSAVEQVQLLEHEVSGAAPAILLIPADREALGEAVSAVIDPEFAFYGPMGYDIGNVIGNLFFAWANKAYTGGSAETQTALEQTIRETCDKTADKLAAAYDKLVTFPLYRAPAFRKAYLDGVMADAYGYAGTEIIRRVVGDSKVMEVTSVTDPAQRLPMERALIDLGIYLIKNRAGGLAGAAVTEEFHKILAEGRGTHGQNG